MKGNPEILITGGTSGLGLELVNIFMKKGYLVTALGRDPSKLPYGAGILKFACTDFNNLGQTAMIVKELRKVHDFDYVINNAGILSPPGYDLSDDGIEITFQVNFLAHLLINELIINSKPEKKELKIFTVTSPAFRLAGKNLNFILGNKKYRPFPVYAESKFCLLIMNSYLSEKYTQRRVSCFGLNPGVFRSGIRRTQGPTFRFLYGIAAPFMKNPSRIALSFSRIIEKGNLVNGAVYGLNNTSEIIHGIRGDIASEFWTVAYKKINDYLNY